MSRNYKVHFIASFLGKDTCICTSHSSPTIEYDLLSISPILLCGATLSFSGFGKPNFSSNTSSERPKVSCRLDNGKFIAVGIFPLSCNSEGSRTSGVVSCHSKMECYFVPMMSLSLEVLSFSLEI